MRKWFTKKELGWALYDWANSAFATVVIAGFFPIYFKRFLAAGVADTVSTFWLGAGDAAASLILAVSAPILGAMSDHESNGKRWLLACAALGIVANSALAFLPSGAWQSGLFFFALAAFFFSCANIFYDALLRRVITPTHPHRASSLGYALGYIGGGLLFLFC